MKLRLFTGLALALSLGGCASYGYVGDGGGYYTGGSSTRYISDYDSYGYGVYGYGSPYYSYRYNPGWSFGLRYGYPYSYYPYAGGGYGSSYYPRPPHNHYPRPPRPDHDHGGRPDHDGRPDRPPPVANGNPPPLNRGPWRDLERLRRGEGGEGVPRRQPGPGTLGIGQGPSPGVDGGPRPGGYQRPSPPQGYRAQAPRYSGAGNDDPGASRPPPRSERSTQRSAPRASESRRSESSRTGTPDTIEP
ncbi:hypothetical protein MNQ95_07085 [Pseudoxanthomonas daejeonensis]|uniref:Lipoprotein n=1 Tax=Pseudoxanthomonas daejeonensis TaxID=266062 RepID=A0ABQ6Z6N0_9GAMM|nr:hypothetical protein [Pseudoxanthomonas daejeonensis]KAF1694376.1 hypothetical protein CSC65_09315 [Pseudoxanthomonas daejeonensis]UNK58839.1 hypothetical protein MNQ95_07085 [Pseudoxanthomonas daejeonensis]